MKLGNKLWMGAAAIAFTAGMNAPANAAVESVDIDAVIVNAIVLTEVQQLDFGTLTPGVGAGTAVVNPDGTSSTTGGVAFVGGTQQEAIVNIAATAGYTMDTSTDASVILTSGGDTMTVDTFDIDTIGGGDTVGILIPVGDNVDVPIGATLQVGAAQAPGAYAGTFDYTVDYP